MGLKFVDSEIFVLVLGIGQIMEVFQGLGKYLNIKIELD